MKRNFICNFVLALAAMWLCPLKAETTTNFTDAVEMVRSMYRTDRQAFLAENLQWTEKESEVFWPLYRSYRNEVDKIGDELVKLVLEYADLYPDVPPERAAELLKQFSALEKKLVDKRASYFKRASKVLPPAKVLRWAQLENRLDLVLRLQLARGVPLVPAGSKH